MLMMHYVKNFLTLKVVPQHKRIVIISRVIFFVVSVRSSVLCYQVGIVVLLFPFFTLSCSFFLLCTAERTFMYSS